MTVQKKINMTSFQMSGSCKKSMTAKITFQRVNLPPLCQGYPHSAGIGFFGAGCSASWLLLLCHSLVRSSFMAAVMAAAGTICFAHYNVAGPFYWSEKPDGYWSLMYCSNAAIIACSRPASGINPSFNCHLTPFFE